MTTRSESRAWMLDVLGNWADRGWLRRLDIALVRFIAGMTMNADADADAATLLAIALTANLEGQGHTCLVLTDLLADPDGLLGWPSDAADALRFVLARMPATTAGWTVALTACGAVDRVIERVVDDQRDVAGNTPFVLDGDRFYLRRYWLHERRIATACFVRAATPVIVDESLAREWIDRLFDARDGDDGVDWQKVACALALRSRIALIIGGPGTGKTYTAARLLALLFATSPDPSTLRVALAAPTGKAAARLRQSIDTAFAHLPGRRVGIDLGETMPWAGRIGPARTLHALLGTQRRSRRFRHDAAHPLDLDVLIVDEASMIHVEMMDALLAALPAHASLVLLGDKDQLSSVEAGAVLGELSADSVADANANADARADRYTDVTIDAVERLTGQHVPRRSHDAAGAILAQRTCMLRRSERFGGAIARFAGAVNAGRVDEARAAIVPGDDALAIVEDATATAATGLAARGYGAFIAVLASRPDSLLGEDHDAWVRRVLDAFDTFRVLCAVREGEWGVAGFNRAIERVLAFDTDGWYEGRAVIATRNDYDLGIFNGDVGIALRASASDARLRVWFVAGDDAGGHGSGVRSVSASRLADVETAFAMTVHRAQGSEFDAVMLVLPAETSRVVTRELLYTGITRARDRFTLVSARRASLDEAIVRTTRRSSGIAAMLRNAA